MNLILSLDYRLIERARKAAEAKGATLDQLIRRYLEELAAQSEPDAGIE